MRLLSRYLLGQLLAPFLFSLGALTGMLMLNQIAKRFGDLVGKGLPADVITEVLLLFLPFIVALTLPMAVLVSVLYGFSHLAADNEITAMRATGVSVAQMLRPVFAAGVLVAALNFLFIDQVLPRSNARLRTLQMDIGRKRPTLTMREQAVNQLPPTEYFIRAGTIEPGTGRMRDVTIYDLTLPNARRIIYADSGAMMFEENARNLRLRLFRGEVHEYRPEEEGTVRVTQFDVNTIRARDVANVLERSTEMAERGDRELSVCQMIDRRELSQEQAARARDQREDLTRRDLRSILRQRPAEPRVFPEPGRRKHCGAWRRFEDALGRVIFPAAAEAQAQAPASPPQPLPPATPPDTATGARPYLAPVMLSSPSDVAEARGNQRSEVRSANSLGVEIHKKFTISVSCFNFVVIGIALALRFPRGGMGLVLGGSMLIFTLFYVGMTAGEQLADRGFLTPAAAMWAPNVLIGALGLLGLRAASRTTGTTRGGDLADLIDLMFGWLRRRRRA
ncbi:MAG TPA: LptF/LptG family permease [Gemmatimonadales bacterium]